MASVRASFIRDAKGTRLRGPRELAPDPLGRFRIIFASEIFWFNPAKVAGAFHLGDGTPLARSTSSTCALLCKNRPLVLNPC